MLKTQTLNKLIYNYLINNLITPENTVKLLDTSKLDEFIKNIVAKKMAEAHHKIDSGNEAYRWRTGMGGELALEQLLGKPFVDLSIGVSDDYHVPDLSKLGLDVGIKSVERGKYPVIFKRSEKPEIVILRLADDTFSVLGLALVEDLNKYQDDSQILSPALRARGTKTAFTGLHKLKGFNNLDELMGLIQNKKA
jgi:hypothetical protein